MRTTVPYILVFIIAFQWMAGQVIVKNIAAVEVQHQMGARESDLSKQLESETGLRTTVKIIDESEINTLAIGYSNQFIFSEEIDGEQVYFMLVQDSVQVVEYQASSKPFKENSSPSPLEQLFSKFTLSEPLPTINKQIPALATCSIQPSFMANLHDQAIPTPPPQLG